MGSVALSQDTVHSLFQNLEEGKTDDFFEHVAEDVEWTVMGTHPLAGHYTSKKAFREATFAKLAPFFPQGLHLHIKEITISGARAVVELQASEHAKTGLQFDNTYCWIVDFKDSRIIRVRAYLDSALVAQLFKSMP
jgi:ketosteroid isomerase-like protein